MSLVAVQRRLVQRVLSATRAAPVRWASAVPEALKTDLSGEVRRITSPLDGLEHDATVLMAHPHFEGRVIVECSDSGLQVVDPPVTETELAELYDKDYNAAYGRDYNAIPEFVSRRAAAQTSFVREHVDVGAAGVVVEVGGGWGALSTAMAAHSPKPVICYEYDSEAVAFMRTCGVDARLGSFEGDAAMKDFPKGSVDLIMSSMMFEHLPGPRESLTRWREALKPGAALFMEIPLENPSPNWWGADPANPYWVGHLTFFAKHHLPNMLTDLGFTLQAATCHDHPVSPGYLMQGDTVPYDSSKVPVSEDTAISGAKFPKLMRILATVPK